MLRKRQTYYFADFRVELPDKMLFQKEKSISLTPKMFETLIILLENSGRVVTKEDLMQQIWHDRFVEENNLTFNIKMLRKALGDDAKNPRFIETIPRRGYRFIAEVKESDSEDSKKINTVPNKSKSFWGRRRVLTAVILIALIGSIGYGALVWQKRLTNIPVLSNGFNLVKLTNSGSSAISVISPDGKYIAFTSEANKKQSVWLREVDTGKNTNIIPFSKNNIYTDLHFSNDGRTLFFSGKTEDDNFGIYAVPTSGGYPEKIISDSQGAISISRDNTKIAFTRLDSKDAKNNKLIVADIDGKNEKFIRESDLKARYGIFSFSPDNKKLTASYGHTDSGSQEMSLVDIDLATGGQSEILDKKFFNIRSINWLKDEKTILISAAEKINEPLRLWQVDYENKQCEPLSFDSANYKHLSLDSANDKLSAVTVTADFGLYLSDFEGSKSPERLIQSKNGFALTVDGRVIYTSDMNGANDIWMMNADGSNQHQLTTDKSLDAYPIVSSDNNFIYFTSNRTGEMHVWRMKLDGSEQIQITKENGGFPMFAASDGKTLYYQKSHPKGIWQISLETGEEKEVFPDKLAVNTSFSPDGKKLIYVRKEENGENKIELIDLEKKSVTKSFTTPSKDSVPVYLNWIPNTNSIVYVVRSIVENDTLWVQNLDKKTPIFSKNLGNDDIDDFKISPNGKSFMFIRGEWKHDAVLLTGLK